MKQELQIIQNEEQINQIQILVLIYQIAQKSTFDDIQNKLQIFQEKNCLPPFIIILGLDHYTNQRQVQIQNGIELSQQIDGFWLEIDRLSKNDKDYKKLNEIFDQIIQMIQEDKRGQAQQNQIQAYPTEEYEEQSEELQMSQFGFGDQYYTREQLQYEPEQDVEDISYQNMQDSQMISQYDSQYDQQQDNSLMLTRQLPDMRFKMDTDNVYYDPVKPRRNKILASQQRVIDDLKQQRIDRLNSKIAIMDEEKIDNKLRNLESQIKVTETQRHQKTLLLPTQKIKMNTMQFDVHLKNKQLESEKFWSTELRKMRQVTTYPRTIQDYQQIWSAAPSYIQDSQTNSKKQQTPIKILEIEVQNKLIKIPIYTTSIPYILAKETVRTYDLDKDYIDKLKKIILEEKEQYQQDQYYQTHKCINKKITIDLLNGDQIRGVLFKKDTLQEALQRICKQYQIKDEQEIQNIAQQIRLDIYY